jgi:protein gp37
MADGTHIEWTDATWSPVRARLWEIQNDGSGKERVGWHCEHVSEGCRNCYAEKINLRLGTGFEFKPGNLRGKPGYYGGDIDRPKLFLDEKMLTAPLRWRKPRRIFVCSMTDLFASFVPDEWIDRVFAVMALAGSLPSLSGLRPSPPLGHTFQVLTKRSARMRDYITEISRNPVPRLSDHIAAHMGKIAGATKLFAHLRSDDLAEEIARFIDPDTGGWPLPNVWLGVSAEDQASADARVPDLLATPAAVRFVSAEPLLGPIDFTNHDPTGHLRAAGAHGWSSIWRGNHLGRAALDWIIVGGESGRGARPMHPDWARSIRDQCQAAGVAFLFKQWGAWLPGEANRGQFDPVPMHAYRRCDDHTYEWPPGRHEVCNFDSHPDRWSGDWHAQRVGKAAAGRLLDGRTWDQFPEGGS